MVMMVTVMARQLEKRMLLHSLLRKTATLNAGMPLLFRILVSGLHRVLRRQINSSGEIGGCHNSPHVPASIQWIRSAE